MIKVEQALVDAELGDCFAACLASLLELPLDCVPNPHGGRWFETIQRWLYDTRHQVLVLAYASASAVHSYPGQALVIASVKSQRFEGKTHAVIWDVSKGEMVWDPSPNRAERTLPYEPLRFWFLVDAYGAVVEE